MLPPSESKPVSSIEVENGRVICILDTWPKLSHSDHFPQTPILEASEVINQGLFRIVIGESG